MSDSKKVCVECQREKEKSVELNNNLLSNYDAIPINCRESYKLVNECMIENNHSITLCNNYWKV